MAAIDTAALQNDLALPGLGRVLVSSGKLTQKRAEEIYRKALNDKTHFASELLASGAVSPIDLANVMSATFGAPLLDMDAIDLKRLPRDLVDMKTCLQFRVLPLSKRGNRVMVATSDPTDKQAAEKIQFATQLNVDWIIVELDKLTRALDSLGASAAEAMEGLLGGDFEFDEGQLEADNAEDGAGTGINSAEVDDARVVKFLHKMLLDAISMRASDLHFEPYEHTYRVRFRIDGELRDIASPPVAIKDKLASRIKVISRLDIAENACRRTAA